MQSNSIDMWLCLQELASVKETAAQAVSEFIRSPDLFQFDLFESPTITQLKGDSQYDHLYQLLEIILNGNLQASYYPPSSSPLAAMSLYKSAPPCPVMGV